MLIDVESAEVTNPGWFNESSVESILYDLYDATNEAGDPLTLGFAPIYQVLRNEQRQTPALTTIFSFIDALKANNPNSAGAIDSLVGTQHAPNISFRLHQNQPNPFNPTTTIRYDLPKPADVTLRIYDVKGRLVRTLLHPTWKETGRHTELWDGLNNRGDKVASGIYFYRLTAGNQSLAKKMVLLK